MLKKALNKFKTTHAPWAQHNLADTPFPAREFKVMSLDEWCSRHVPHLERIKVNVRSGKDGLLWMFRGGIVKKSLADALGRFFSDIERRQVLLLEVDDVARRDFDALSAEVSARAFPVLITDVLYSGTGGSNAVSHYWIQLERALFSTGLRKHFAYCELSGPATDRPSNCGRHYGCYAPLPQGFSYRDPAHLAETRDLHMDMLREPGPRSDAHIMRYHYAAKHILDTIGPGAVILDACSGMGYGTGMLATLANAAQTVGVDIDDTAVGYSSAVYGADDRLCFLVSDILSYLRGLGTKSLDAIVMFEGLEHVKEVEDILFEANRVLKATGILISSVPNAWCNEEGIDENPWHVRVFDWDVYRATLSKHLAIRTMLRQVGTRINAFGKWTAMEACFAPVETALITPEPAEWWLSVCQARSVPGQTPSNGIDETSFPLQEVLTRLNDPEIKVVSFDIFDTLLSRPTLIPDDVFDILQLQLTVQHGLLFSGFANLRRRAEAIARQMAHKKGLGDISFDEIYDCLTILMALDPGQRATIQAAELALESQYLKPRSGVQQLYRRAIELGKMVIVVSDMYLPTDFLSDVLASQGYDKVFKLWVSSDYKVQKRTGLLFEVVLDELKAYNVGAGQILHVGDNKHSDIEVAAAHGLKTLHTRKATTAYAGEADLWPSGPKTREGSQVNLGLRSFIGCQVDGVFQDPFYSLERGTVFGRDPYLFGRLRLGAFVYFAMDDLYRRSVELGIRRILFVTRDGHVFKKVFEDIVALRGAAIEARELNISRSVLQQLYIRELNDLLRFVFLDIAQSKKSALIDRLASLTGKTVGALLDEFAEAARPFDHDILTGTLKDSHAQSYTALLERIWPLIREDLAIRRERALANLAIFNETETAVWDVGYFHSAATALVSCGQNVRLSSHLIALAHHDSRVGWYNARYQRHTFLGTINNTDDAHPFTTSTHALLVELLFSDPSTASRRIYTTQGQPVVEIEDMYIQACNRAMLDEVHHGICDAATAFIAAFGNTLDHVDISPTDVLSYAFQPRAISELITDQNLLFDNNGLHVLEIHGGKISTRTL